MAAWLDIVEMAAFKDGFVRNGVTLKRGQALVSARYLAERWGWSKSAASRWLKTLQTEGQLQLIDRDTYRDKEEESEFQV